MEEAYCYMSQDLYFTLNNTFNETLESVRYKVYSNGTLKGSDKLKRVEDSKYEISPGENTVYLPFNYSTPERTIEIVLDPDNYIEESNENNNSIQRTFSPEKMDIFYYSHEYNDFMDTLYITIVRDKILEYCPPFDLEVYVDGGLFFGNPTFFGFSGALGQEGEVWVENLDPGTHEIELIIDTWDVVDESNEANNEPTFTVEIPE